MDPLDLASLTRWGLRAGATCTLSWRYGGRLVGSAKISQSASEKRLRIEHVEINWDGTEALSSANVWLVTKKQHLGGEREWFECPSCRRACRVLYGRAGFRCRRCAGLIYHSQATSAHGRALIVAQKIRVRLGGSGSVFEPFPRKPRTMHWKTYRRIKARHDRLAAGYTDRLEAVAARLQRHLST